MIEHFDRVNNQYTLSVTIEYTTANNETREKTLNIKPHNTLSYNLQAIFDMDNTRMLQFDFEQRKDHLTG